jgi:hypothetical protein
LAEQALLTIGALYEVEPQAKDIPEGSFAYLKDVLTRLPTQRAGAINQFLPHQWAQGSKYALSYIQSGASEPNGVEVGICHAGFLSS